MKKILVLVVALMIVVVGNPSYMSTENDYMKEADALNSLGLFNGTNNGYELERAPTRVEAAAMLVKLLGAENEAKTKHYKHPFTDVPAWATDIVGYLYENKMTTGIGNNQFGSANLMSAKDFTVFVLRSLGYTSEFSYADTMNFAVSKKLISASEMTMLTSNSFKRDEMVLLAFNALKTQINGDTYTLGDKFANGGVVDAQTAFDLGLTLRNEVTVSGLNGGSSTEIVLNNAITWGTLKLQEITNLYVDSTVAYQSKTYEAYKGALWINSGTKQWQNMDMYFEVIVYNKGIQVFKQEVLNTNYGVNKYYIMPIFPKMQFDEIKIIGYPKEMRTISDELASKVQIINLDQLSLLEADIKKYKNVKITGYGDSNSPKNFTEKNIDEVRRFALLQYEFFQNNKSLTNYYSNTIANQDSEISVVFGEGESSSTSIGATSNSYIYTLPKPSEQTMPFVYQLLNPDGTIGKIYIGVIK